MLEYIAELVIKIGMIILISSFCVTSAYYYPKFLHECFVHYEKTQDEEMKLKKYEVLMKGLEYRKNLSGLIIGEENE